MDAEALLSLENPLRCARCSESDGCHLDLESSEQSRTLTSYLDQLRALVTRGGPEPSEYDSVTDGLRRLSEIMGACGLRQRHVCRIREALGDSMSVESMQGFALHKPYGYAGDFDIIDRIYTQRVSADARLGKWDRFYHSQQAPTAVRNRKAYFKSFLARFAGGRDASVERIRVLNVASGPARDIFEYFSEGGDQRVHFDCVETDPRAIQYAKTLCGSFLSRITFHQVNALRFASDERYDLVWSAGLFDYFNDRLFVRLLTRLAKLTGRGGEVVIGNFGDKNSSRPYMELVGEWSLHHRSEQSLMALASAAVGPLASVTVESEPSGLNLFVRIRVAPGAP